MIKLHAHALLYAIIFVMQFCQYGCLSTRLDLRNKAYKADFAQQINLRGKNWIYLWKYFSFLNFENPLYILVKSRGFGGRVNQVRPSWFFFAASHEPREWNTILADMVWETFLFRPILGHPNPGSTFQSHNSLYLQNMTIPLLKWVRYDMLSMKMSFSVRIPWVYLTW